MENQTIFSGLRFDSFKYKGSPLFSFKKLMVLQNPKPTLHEKNQILPRGRVPHNRTKAKLSGHYATKRP